MAVSVGSDTSAVTGEGSETNATPGLDGLPAELLLKILHLLPIADLLSVAELGSGCRLGRIAGDPSNFRTICLSKCYNLTRVTLEVLLSRRRRDIHHLDVSNCYWLTADDFAAVDFRLPNLQRLDVRHTSFPFKALHRLLSHAKSLRSLSYNQDRGVRPGDVSRAAARTLRRLGELNAVLVPGVCVVGGNSGERPLLEYGANYGRLDAFTVDARHVGDADCSCSGRLVTDVIPFERLSHFAIGRRSRDAHSHWSSFDAVGSCPAYQRSVQFADGCLSHIDPNRNDGDGGNPGTAAHPSKVLSLHTNIVPDLRLQPYRSLRYLNIAGSASFAGLHALASNCPHLVTLNLSYCKDAFKKVYQGEEWTDVSAFRIFAEARTPLKHLNISGLHPHLPDNELCEVLAQLPGLESLSFPVCGLPERKDSIPVDGLTFKHIQSRTRSCSLEDFRCNQCSRSETYSTKPGSTNEPARQEGCSYCITDLSRLVTGCPKMRSFELTKTGFASFLSPRALSKDEDAIRCGDIMDPESTLLCISRWRQLRSLVLAGLPSLFHGRSLVAIAQGCPQLQSLSLAHLGPHPYDQCLFMDGLCEALKHTERLQEFRFEQPKVVGMQSLLKSLQRCRRLSRVCLITQCGRVKALNELDEVIDQCADLVALQVICNAYYETCAKWQQALLHKYKPTRPALHILVASHKKCEASRWRDVCDKVPFVHLDELTLFQTRVAAKAPSWAEIQTIRSRTSCGGIEPSEDE